MLTDNCQARGGLHSEFIEPSRNSLKAMSVGKSRVQATDHVDLQQVPLTGYEQFPQEMQAYPVSREPVTVQPTNHDNNSALLDLPNVQANLPRPLTPRRLNQVSTGSVDGTRFTAKWKRQITRKRSTHKL